MSYAILMVAYESGLGKATVRSLLEVMVEPLARSLVLAEVEQEQITPEMAAALERARASLARGEGIPHEEILSEFGLKQ